MPRRRNLIAAFALLVLLMGAFVGFLGSGGDGKQDAVHDGDPAQSGGMMFRSGANESTAMADLDAATAGGTGAGGAAAPAGGPSAAPADPKIVKNATVRVEVGKDGFRKAFESASRVAGAHGGFVVSSESSTESEADSHGVLVLRVPAASFDAVRADLAGLGKVKDERITGEDVGGRIVDLDARIRSLQVQEEALRTLMGKAKTVGETIEVQNQLTAVRQQIEQHAGEKARLEDAAALATVRAELFEPGAPAKADEPESSPLRQAVTEAVEGAETVVAGTIIVLGWMIPLALLAGLAAAGWLAARRRRPALTEHPS